MTVVHVLFRIRAEQEELERIHREEEDRLYLKFASHREQEDQRLKEEFKVSLCIYHVRVSKYLYSQGYVISYPPTSQVAEQRDVWLPWC